MAFAPDAQVTLRVPDLRPTEAAQLQELRSRPAWAGRELTKLVQTWFGALGPYVTAKLAMSERHEEMLVISFRTPPREQADIAAKEYKRALKLAQNGRLPEAFPHFERAASLWPLDSDYLMGLGHAHLELGDLDQAETTLLLCLRLEPEHVDATTLLGNVYFARGKRGCRTSSTALASSTAVGF